jgi:Tfp pilus assembly pilus retraction ATPase PilT
MKKSKSLFSQLYKKAILYGLVDEGGWFPQMLASRKTTAEYTKLTKNFLSNQRNQRQKIRVNLCESVSNFPLCLRVFVAEIRSIKNNNLCETNPIFQKVKCL